MNINTKKHIFVLIIKHYGKQESGIITKNEEDNGRAR